MAKILLMPVFKKQVKIIKRRFKCKNIKNDILLALNSFLALSDQQKKQYSISNKQYKIRVGSKDLQKGKRGVFRAILVIIGHPKKIFVPFAFFSKNDFDDLPLTLKNMLLNQVKKELKDFYKK